MRSRREVGSVMTADVVTVGPDTPFKAVAVLLEGHHFHRLPVVDDEGRLVGVVSRSDRSR